MDTRLYHVPKRYQSFATMSPSVVLQEMRQSLTEQFKTIAQGSSAEGSGSSAEAKILQDFFQQIKNMTSKTADGTIESKFSNVLMQEVISRAEANSQYKAGREWFKMWGGKDQGKNFEKELATIVASVANMTGAHDLKGTKLMTGSGTIGAVNIGGYNNKQGVADVLNPIVRSWLESSDEQLKKMAQDMMKRKNELITVNVSGKIDVTALTVEYKFVATGNALFDQAARLLKSATFTAKSYASLSKEWLDEYQEVFVRASYTNELHFGTTKLNRIYIDMLMKYGNLPYPVAASFFYRSMHSKGRKPMEELNRLRYIYELTGYGQTYVTEWFQKKIEQESGMGAKYLIYNDPASNNIYVKSTAEIVQDVMAQFINRIKRGTSVLGKSYFTD